MTESKPFTFQFRGSPARLNLFVRESPRLISDNDGVTLLARLISEDRFEECLNAPRSVVGKLIQDGCVEGVLLLGRLFLVQGYGGEIPVWEAGTFDNEIPRGNWSSGVVGSRRPQARS